MPSSLAKAKLRTISDVLSRLRWSNEHSQDEIVLGYDDRIHGPMEKSLPDYKPIKDGGDIPEHRIWYVRTALSSTNDTKSLDASVLWDRLGRVDRVFGSGNGGSECPISTETLQHISQAMDTMVRLDLEKQERRAIKEKERAAKARKRAAKAAALNYLAAGNKQTETPSNSKRVLRYEWIPTPWYSYSEDSQDWEEGSSDNDMTCDSSSSPSNPSNLTVVTWNVLFDLYDNELDDHEERWALIGSILSQQDADVIALQEVTPTFVPLLLAQPWIQKQYASTASPFNTDTVHTSGNLLLWRKNILAPLDKGLHVCVDSFRQCSIMASLERRWDVATPDDPILLLTNVHLLANKPSTNQTIGSRALARQRELSSVIGQLQMVEQHLLQSGRVAHPILVGDFNSSDPETQCLTGTFVDIWPIVTEQDDPGYTFDPRTNVRAARTRSLTSSNEGPKRLDRMYVAQRPQVSSSGKELSLEPLNASLVGLVDISSGEVPPSDHYGLLVTFESNQWNGSSTNQSPKACLKYPGHNEWAMSVNSSPDTLLALVLDESHLLGKDLFNATSTLPVPHITLLHGFVELSCHGFLELTIRALRDAIDSTRETHEDCMLRFTESSLDVFEHRSSATLIARPDTQHVSSKWLLQLYNSLTTTFRQCREQESRFGDGWTPHLSLGTFGTAIAARTEAAKRLQEGRWVDREMYLPIYGVTVFERSAIDGKFYAVASVPFQRGANMQSVSIEALIQDGFSAYASSFKGTCCGVLSEIRRACQAVADDDIVVKVSTYGSHAMNAALPTISDIDAVVELVSVSSSIPPLPSGESGLNFLRQVADLLKRRYGAAKCRVRSATAADSDVTIPILTIKLWSSAPLVDLECCQRFRDGQPVDEPSKIALEAKECTTILYDALRDAYPENYSDVCEVVSGVLRVIKLWAFRRGVYGSSAGFLGGGSWAVLLVHSMVQGSRDGILSSSSSIPEVVKYFFYTSNRWSLPLSVNLSSDDDSPSNRPITIRSSRTTDNLARSTTRPTSLTILAELKRSASLLSLTNEPYLVSRLRTVLEPYTLADFLSSFETAMVIHVIAIPERASPCNFGVADVKAWARRQLLQLTVKLERVADDASQIRPRPTPVRMASRHEFLWFIGLQVPLQSADLQEFLETKQSPMQLDWKSTFPNQTDLPTLEAKSSEETLQYLTDELGIDVNKH